MAKRTWMQPICAADMPHISKPFPIQYEGERWDCATNGCCLLLVRGPTFRQWKGQCAASGPTTALDEAACGKRRGTASLADLRRWARPTKDGRGGCVFGVRVDRGLVARVLRAQLSDAKPVRVSAGGRFVPVRFEGDGWIALVMPWRAEGGPRCPLKAKRRARG